jgi:hypothetical protein
VVAAAVAAHSEWTSRRRRCAALLRGNVAQGASSTPALPNFRVVQEDGARRHADLPEAAFPIFGRERDISTLAQRAGQPRRPAVRRRGRGAGLLQFRGEHRRSPPGHKQHLVPFGEYLPWPVFGWVLDVLHMPMADLAGTVRSGAPGRPGSAWP